MERLLVSNITPTASDSAPLGPRPDVTTKGATSDENPQPSEPNNHARKRLLLQILDALRELNGDDLDEGTKTPPKDKSFKDSRVQRALNAAGQFNTFRRLMLDLDEELQNLTKAFGQVGSVGIISSSVQLRSRLAKILFLFNLNASNFCFPYVTVEYPPDTITNWKLHKEPQELELLRDDLLTFLKYLHEFPVLTHEPLVNSVLQFRQALKHWAVSLEDFQGNIRNPIAEQYLHELCDEMKTHLVSVTTAVGNYIEHVVPSIRHAQQRKETTLVSLSGLAAFVSAVTATGIQVAFDQTDDPLKNAVNAFWFSSLVFSVTSAVNALLGLAWSQSQYRSPRDRVPWLISVWITQGPFAFLIAALVAFSVGLALFTWASGQHLITCVLTTVFTGISLFSLLIVSVWFAFERSVFVQYKGERLLADVVSERRFLWKHRIRIHTVARISAWYRMWATYAFQAISNIESLFRKIGGNWRCNTTSYDAHSAHGNVEGLPTRDHAFTLPDSSDLPSSSSFQTTRPKFKSSRPVNVFDKPALTGDRVLGAHILPLYHRQPTPRPHPRPEAPRIPYIRETNWNYDPEFEEPTRSAYAKAMYSQYPS